MDLSDTGYVTDARQYGAAGKQTGGGWMVMWREVRAGQSAYVEGAVYRTKSEAGAALRLAARERAARSAASLFGRQGGLAGRGAAKHRDVDYAALGRKGATARMVAAAHRDGTCRCADVVCSAGHVGADGGHCACGDLLR